MENFDSRPQEAIGMAMAANATIAAMCAIHPDKAALRKELVGFDALTMDLLRKMEQRYPDRGQTMQEAYLQVMAGYRQILAD